MSAPEPGPLAEQQAAEALTASRINAAGLAGQAAERAAELAAQLTGTTQADTSTTDTAAQQAGTTGEGPQ